MSWGRERDGPSSGAVWTDGGAAPGAARAGCARARARLPAGRRASTAVREVVRIARYCTTTVEEHVHCVYTPLRASYYRCTAPSESTLPSRAGGIDSHNKGCTWDKRPDTRLT